MRAGQLRHPIIIQELTATNTGGVTTNVWAEYDAVRAEVVPLSGTEIWAAKQVQDADVVQFRIRYLDGVTQKMRILHNYKAYDIKSVIDAKGRGKMMDIRCTLAPQEYATFAYGDVTFAAGDASGEIVATWTTGFYSSSRMQIRESGESEWVTKSHRDTSPRVLSHSYSLLGIENSKTYEVRLYGENEAGWTPGWSGTASFETGNGGEIVDQIPQQDS